MKIFYWTISVVNFSTQSKQNSELSSLFLYLRSTFCIGLICLLCACQPASEQTRQFVFTGPTMGTEFRVSVVAVDTTDHASMEGVIVEAMDAVNQSMSTYISSSELSVFNRLGKGTQLDISDALSEVMTEALTISELSGGAFDVTIGQAIRLWGFGADGRITQQPDESLLQTVKQSIGYRNVLLNGKRLSKAVSGLEVDLSAIAKGYAVDRVAQALEDQGVRNYLVNIGGELRARGRNIDGQVWRVGIEKPHVLGGIQQVVTLSNSAIATSGDYRNYHIIDGQHFSHTIDPATLKPVFHKLALVSVISKRASTADALATALMTMGDEQAMAFADKHGLAAYFVVRGEQQGQFRIQMTDSFRANLVN